MPGHNEVLSFLLLLALVLVAAKAAGWLSLRIGQPAVLGELLAGVVLGPSLFDILHLRPFAGEAMAAGIFLLANIGVVLLMCIVLTATSVSIIVQTLIKLRQLDSKEGTTLLGAAVADDVIALN